MSDTGVALEKGKGLEEWLKEQSDSSFPPYSLERGEKSYPERYEDFKRALMPIHESVEKGAMSAGAVQWMEKAISVIMAEPEGADRDRCLSELFESDPVVYLNNHGRGHVAKVIDKVSEMVQHFRPEGCLTSYEGFMLLCAIQIHDVGNVFGREEHEKRCKEILDDKGQLSIPDGVERKVIEKLALVHGGAVNGKKDTIGFLSPTKCLHSRNLRKRLLAALLRFGDELADDSSRADREGLARGIIPENSIIYHCYSQALHTVAISKEPENDRLQVHLSFDFDSDKAIQKFNKNGETKYLLDEIYDRTLKMERERRYCMRFLRPYFSLDSIRVEITIQHSKDPWVSHKIHYTLQEDGYPSDPASGYKILPDLRSGEDEKKFLMEEWGISC